MKLTRAALLVLVACHGAPAEHAASEPVRVASVARGKIVDRVVLTGDLHAASAIDLSVPRTDTWELTLRWLAEDGQQVKAGDRVLEFDNSAFTKELDEKRLGLREAEMTLASTRALSTIETQTKQLEVDQHQLELAKAQIKAEVPPDLLTGRDAQERQLEKKRAQVAVDKARQDLVAQKQEAALELDVKQIDLEKSKHGIEAAEDAIAKLVVTAPRDGVLVVDNHPWLGRKYQVGDSVQPGMTIMSIPDPSSGMEVQADLSDVDDGRVHVGDTGTCTLDAYPADAIPCKVDKLTPVARPEGVQRGSLRRAFAVVLSLGTKPGADSDRMRPGMSVKVELHDAELADVLVVPRGAVIVDGKATRVRLGSGELHDVVLGACDAQACAVKAGLAAGDSVRL